MQKFSFSSFIHCKNTSHPLILIFFYGSSSRRQGKVTKLFTWREQHNTCYYRPQRSWGKVMFLHLSVSHSVLRGGRVSQHALGQTPSPGRHIPACTGADTPLSRHIPACTGADTPPPPPGRWLLLRTVRILLECIHVHINVYSVVFIICFNTYFYLKLKLKGAKLNCIGNLPVNT